MGIPAFIGGVMLFGGAACFSKTQECVWGRFLIENPQEERVNTKLARYGASVAPWKDFILLLKAFFLPAESGADTALRNLSEFKVN